MSDGDERYERGMKVRREVLGNAHVDRAEAKKTAFSAPFQEYITRAAWGDVWARPGLERRERRLLTLALMVALNHEEELAMHARAALADGITAEEISEVLLHSAVYAGVPSANRAFARLQKVLEEEQGPAA